MRMSIIMVILVKWQTTSVHLARILQGRISAETNTPIDSINILADNLEKVWQQLLKAKINARNN